MSDIIQQCGCLGCHDKPSRPCRPHLDGFHQASMAVSVPPEQLPQPPRGDDCRLIVTVDPWITPFLNCHLDCKLYSGGRSTHLCEISIGVCRAGCACLGCVHLTSSGHLTRAASQSARHSESTVLIAQMGPVHSMYLLDSIVRSCF